MEHEDEEHKKPEGAFAPPRVCNDAHHGTPARQMRVRAHLLGIAMWQDGPFWVPTQARPCVYIRTYTRCRDLMREGDERIVSQQSSLCRNDTSLPVRCFVFSLCLE